MHCCTCLQGIMLAHAMHCCTCWQGTGSGSSGMHGRALRGGLQLLVFCPLKLRGSMRLPRDDGRRLLGVPQLSRERVDHGHGSYRLQRHVHGHLLQRRLRVDRLRPSCAASRLRHEDSVLDSDEQLQRTNE